MQRFYDYQAIWSDVSEAVSASLRSHGLEAYHPIAVCAVLEAIASPLKAQISGPALMQKVGYLGVETYLASLIARRVEVLKSPHSLIVNPMMDAIALALLKKGELPKERMFREALKVYLGLSGKPKNEIDSALQDHAHLEYAFSSALEYLQQGDVIEPCENDTQWRIQS